MSQKKPKIAHIYDSGDYYKAYLCSANKLHIYYYDNANHRLKFSWADTPVHIQSKICEKLNLKPTL